VTPEQYGAVGDGLTDDTVAMQRALNAAAGKTLWLPAAKTYKISKTIAVPSNTTVMGAGKTSVIRFTWRGVTTPDSGGGSNFRSAGVTAHDIHLTNFVLEGGGTGLPAGLNADNPQGLVPLLKLILVEDFSVTHMELRKAEGLAVSYTGGKNGLFRYNYVHHAGRDGITGYHNSAGTMTDIVVDDNLIEKAGDDAIAINGLVPGQNIPVPSDGSNPLPKRITITDNVIRGWESDPNGKVLGRGIALNGVAGVLVQGNTLSHPNSTGILLTGCNPHICNGSSTDWWSTGAQLLNNTIQHSTGGSRPGAIAIIKTRNSTVRGNKATYSSPYDFSGCSGCSISDNAQ
jgi:polygalacturonase